MANIVKTYTFVNSQPADGTQVNKNFDDIINGVGDLTTLRPTVASLGLDADLVTLALPANTTISAAGAELINDADAAAQRATLGAVATGDISAWAKAGTKPTYASSEIANISAAGRGLISQGDASGMILILGAVTTTDSRLSNARPASDVSAWAKAASKPTYTAAEVGTRKITTGTANPGSYQGDFAVTHGLGTTPSFVLVTLGNQVQGVSAKTSTTFTYYAGANQIVSWIAVA